MPWWALETYLKKILNLIENFSAKKNTKSNVFNYMFSSFRSHNFSALLLNNIFQTTLKWHIGTLQTVTDHWLTAVIWAAFSCVTHYLIWLPNVKIFFLHKLELKMKNSHFYFHYDNYLLLNYTVYAANVVMLCDNNIAMWNNLLLFKNK